MTVSPLPGSATLLSPAVGLAVPVDPDAPGGQTFAQALLDLIDGQGARREDDQRSFANGTMPRTVDPFDAHGFFDGSAPLAPTGGPAVLPATTLASSAPDEIMTPGPVSSSATPAATVPLASGDQGAAAPPPVTGSSDAGAAPGVTLASAVSAATGIPAAVAPLPNQPAAPARLVLRSTPDAPAKAIARPTMRVPVSGRDQASPGGTATAVILEQGEHGVAVSVVSDHLSGADDGALHLAVARLLARHGLVLSDLRITRRAATDSHSEGGN